MRQKKDLALNVFYFFLNSSLTLLPSMASSLILLKSISQKMSSNPKQIRQDNNELQQHLEVPAQKCQGWLTSAPPLLLTLNMPGDTANKTDLVLLFFLINCCSSLMQLNYTRIPPSALSLPSKNLSQMKFCHHDVTME